MKKNIQEIIVKVERKNSTLHENGVRNWFIEEKEILRSVDTPNVMVRIGHFVIDLLVCIALTYSVLEVIYSFNLNFRDKNTKVILFLVLYFFYYLVTEYFFQRTIGKFISGTIIINQYAEKPNFISILKRTFLRLFSLIFNLITSTTLDNDKEHRLWHDKKSQTFVVSLKEKKALQELLD